MYSFGRRCPGISQWRVIGTPSTARRVVAELFSQRLEIDRAGKRRQHHELRERQPGPLGQRNGGVEGVGTVARQPEDERARARGRRAA